MAIKMSSFNLIYSGSCAVVNFTKYVLSGSIKAGYIDIGMAGGWVLYWRISDYLNKWLVKISYKITNNVLHISMIVSRLEYLKDRSGSSKNIFVDHAVYGLLSPIICKWTSFCMMN